MDVLLTCALKRIPFPSCFCKGLLLDQQEKALIQVGQKFQLECIRYQATIARNYINIKLEVVGFVFLSFFFFKKHTIIMNGMDGKLSPSKFALAGELKAKHN